MVYDYTVHDTTKEKKVMSKLNSGNGGSSNWQELAKKAWEEIKEQIANDGIASVVATPKQDRIKDSTLDKKEITALVGKARDLVTDLVEKEALIVGGKAGGGVEVKTPALSIYKDTLTIDFGRAKATKDADPVAVKAVLDKDGAVTGVYASTSVKEAEKKDGTGKFTYCADFRAYENVKNLPPAIKSLTEAIGFSNPVKENANRIELPEAVQKVYDTVWDKIKPANETAPKGKNQKGEEVKQYFAQVQKGVLTDKGYFDNREGIEGKAGYQISIADHAEDGQNKFDITLDETGAVINGKITDFGTKDETGKYASVFNSNINYLADKNNGLGVAQIMKSTMEAIGYVPPKYEKDEKAPAEQAQEAPAQEGFMEIPDQLEEELPFR